MVKVTGKSLSSLEITIVFQKKSFFKKMSLQITFKTLKSEVHIRSYGRLFHSFVAAATKA